ncbi:MAG: translation elongation factor Ts [Lentisphaeria bacterium]
MPNITAAMVKKLRDQTGAGMMDCKKALSKAEGDMVQALEHLRKAGVAKAAKKAERTAKEGVVQTQLADNTAVIVEVLCETDFAAKNPNFVSYAEDLAKRIAADYDGDCELGADLADKEEDRIGGLVTQIGENIQVRRAVRWESKNKFGEYMHMGGKIGVVVEADGASDDEIMRDVAMHIAAFNPRFIAPEDIPAEILEKEREIAKAQVEGKPDHIIDKIIDGKINKWYTEVCLTKQPWLRDDKTCLAKVAPNMKIKRFARWAIGEEL